MTPIDTYRAIDQLGYPLPPIIEVLIKACLAEIDERDYKMQLLACLVFDIWWSGK